MAGEHCRKHVRTTVLAAIRPLPVPSKTAYLATQGRNPFGERQAQCLLDVDSSRKSESVSQWVGNEALLNCQHDKFADFQVRQLGEDGVTQQSIIARGRGFRDW